MSIADVVRTTRQRKRQKEVVSDDPKINLGKLCDSISKLQAQVLDRTILQMFEYALQLHAANQAKETKRELEALEHAKDLLGIAETALRTGHKIPDSWQPRVKSLLYGKHSWDENGETCVICGSKDWMAGPCRP